MTTQARRCLCALAVGLVVSCGAGHAQAKIWYVDDDGPADFSRPQPAVDAAQNGDTIIVRDGTYLREGGSQNYPVIDFKGKAITVRSENGPANCILSKGDHVVQFNSGETHSSVLCGFTITGADPGGGINCWDSSPTILNNIVTGNWSEYGLGAILLHNSSAIVAGNIVMGNRVYGPCAGIYVCHGSDATIVNNTIVSNAEDPWEDNNGAIYCTHGGTATIANCICWDNGDYDLFGCSATYSCLEHEHAGTGNTHDDPRFVSLGYRDVQNYEYVDYDFHLLSDSPCIDAGDNTAVPPALTVDIDGNPRLLNFPGVPDTGYPPGAQAIVDMGAYEAVPEPSMLALLGAGLAGLLGRRKRRR